MTNKHQVPWEEELDKENWHAIEGENGRCACGSEQGICHTRLKSFIRSLLASHHAHLKERVDKLEKNLRNYDGNNLQSACDAYMIAAENWTEIIRYEDGYKAALADVKELLE